MSILSDKTLTPRSYLCAMMVLGCPPTSTSRRARDWECGLSPLLQSNWARTSLEPPKSREMSSSFRSPVNKFQKGELRRPDVCFGSLADIGRHTGCLLYPQSGHAHHRHNPRPLCTRVEIDDYPLDALSRGSRRSTLRSVRVAGHRAVRGAVREPIGSLRATLTRGLRSWSMTMLSASSTPISGKKRPQTKNSVVWQKVIEPQSIWTTGRRGTFFGTEKNRHSQKGCNAQDGIARQNCR